MAVEGEGRYELELLDLSGHGDSTTEPSDNYIVETLLFSNLLYKSF